MSEIKQIESTPAEPLASTTEQAPVVPFRPLTASEIIEILKTSNVALVNGQLGQVQETPAYDEQKIAEGVHVKRQQAPDIEIPLLATVGLGDQHELVLLNWDPETSDMIMRAVYDAVYQQDPTPMGVLPLGPRPDDMSVYLLPVQEHAMQEIFPGVVEFHQKRGKKAQYLQVILTDSNDRFPWDPAGCEEELLFGQPLLGDLDEGLLSVVANNQRKFLKARQESMQAEMRQQLLQQMKEKAEAEAASAVPKAQAGLCQADSACAPLPARSPKTIEDTTALPKPHAIQGKKLIRPPTTFDSRSPMCVSFRPSTMSSTRIALVETEHHHTMAYQNTAVSSGPNCMVLPIPAQGDVQLIDMQQAKNLLRDQENALKALLMTFRSASKTLSARGSVRVETVGSYTVVIAKGASVDRVLQAAGGLGPEAGVTRAFLENYLRIYPGWTLLLCFWDGSKEAEPLACRYVSYFPQSLYVPMLDAHDGRPPELGKMVNRDHFISHASYRYQRPDSNLLFTEVPRSVSEFFLPVFYAEELRHSRTPNYDMMIPLDKVRKNGRGGLYDLKPVPLPTE